MARLQPRKPDDLMSDPMSTATQDQTVSMAAQHWAGVLRSAHLVLQANRRRWPSARPCSYGPWYQALAEVGVDPFDLMQFTETASRAPWPQERVMLIAYALTFLETDPMLFRSGYTKRHLLNRLRQSELSSSEIERLTAILKGAVLNGTGLEEFRPCCRVAATHRPPGLQDWLRPLAAEAKLDRYRHLVGDDRQRLPDAYGDRGSASYSPVYGYAPPRHALPADLCGALIRMTPDDWADPANRRAANAWQMLRAMERQSRAGRTLP
jgi:hypothetical protein